MLRVAYLGIKGLPSQFGADRVVEAIATRMPEYGIQPIVYCDRTYTSLGVSIPGVELIRLPTISGKHMRSTTLNTFAALHAVFLSQYDLIHLHNIEVSFVLPLLRLKYQVVTTSHGSAYLRDKWSPLAKWMMRLMEHPFVKLSSTPTSVSFVDAHDLSSRYNRSVQYIPNGVGMEYELDMQESTTILEGHGLTPNEFLIFVAGRIIPTKGAHLIIEALNRVDTKLPLLIVGDLRHTPEYTNMLREMAGPQVRFQPLVTNPVDLFGLMADARVLIFPSTVEAMSMVLLEAAYLGVPTVCSDIPENREVMGEGAVYFQSGSVDSLVERLEWALGHPEDVLQRSHCAKVRVQEQYSWDAIAARYADLYHDVVQNKHSYARANSP